MLVRPLFFWSMFCLCSRVDIQKHQIPPMEKSNNEKCIEFDVVGNRCTASTHADPHTTSQWCTTEKDCIHSANETIFFIHVDCVYSVQHTHSLLSRLWIGYMCVCSFTHRFDKFISCWLCFFLLLCAMCTRNVRRLLFCCFSEPSAVRRRARFADENIFLAHAVSVFRLYVFFLASLVHTRTVQSINIENGRASVMTRFSLSQVPTHTYRVAAAAVATASERVLCVRTVLGWKTCRNIVEKRALRVATPLQQNNP